MRVSTCLFADRDPRKSGPVGGGVVGGGVPWSRPEAGSSECAGKRGVSGAEEPRSAWKMHTNSAPPMGPSGERFCPRSHGRSWRGPGTPFLGIWSDSEGTGLDLRSGPPLGPSGENSARAAYGGWISRMSAFGGRNGRFSLCFPVELGRPSGPQGAPQLKTSMNPNLHESDPNLHHGAVGGKFRPSGSWGVRIGLARVRGSILMIFNGFYR